MNALMYMQRDSPHKHTRDPSVAHPPTSMSLDTAEITMNSSMQYTSRIDPHALPRLQCACVVQSMLDARACGAEVSDGEYHL